MWNNGGGSSFFASAMRTMSTTTTMAMIRGSGGKNVIFQIAPMTKVSTQIHLSMCQYDVYKVSSKKNDWKGSIRGVKVDFFFGGVLSGLGSRIFPVFR